MYQKKDKDLLLEQFRKTPIVQAACRKLGISRATYYRWREDADFAKLADEALVEGALLVNDMAESRLISSVQDGHLPAIQFWLKHHHRAYGTKVELTGALHIEGPLDEEQKRIIRRAMRLAEGERASYEE